MGFRWKKVIVRTTGIKRESKDKRWRLKNRMIEADIKEGVWLLEITG